MINFLNTRYIGMAVLATAIQLLFQSIYPRYEIAVWQNMLEWLLNFFIVFSLWEGHLRFQNWLDDNFPWANKTIVRIIVQLVYTAAISAVVIFIGMEAHRELLCPSNMIEQFDEMWPTAFTIGMLISFLVTSIFISINFFSHWRTTLVDTERQNKLLAEAKYNNLVNQIDPHFLFNSFSVLNSLIFANPDKASEFVQQLSKSYRYILEHKEDFAVLRDEVEFVKAYLFLLKTRFDKNLTMKIDLDKSLLDKQIIPMSLQIMVENAVKHNEISAERPLAIEIYAEGDGIIVKNTLQKRPPEGSSLKVGLANIKLRYEYLMQKQVEVTETDLEFIVKLPLL